MTVSFISAIMFITIGISSCCAGFLTTKFKRTHVILAGLIGITICSILMGAIDNLYSYTVFRCLLGFCLGVNIPITMSILIEYTPLFLRSFTQTSVWIAYTIGNLYFIMVIYLVMPKLEPPKVMIINYYTAIPSFIMFFLYFFFLNDSPRNLIINDEYDQAFEILERIAGRSLSEEEKIRLIEEVKEGENKEYDHNIGSIFKPNILLTTILLMRLWLLAPIIGYIPGIIYSLTLQKLGVNYTSDNLFRDVTINWGVSGVGYFLGIFSELHFIGRRNLCIINYVLASIVQIFACVFPIYFNILYTVSSIFMTTGSQVIQTYTYEFYSTKIREVAGGFFFMCTRVGGFSSQYLGVGLNNISTLLPYYLMVAFGFLSAILLLLLPHDTFGHHLDVNIDKEELEKLKEIVKEKEESSKRN